MDLILFLIVFAILLIVGFMIGVYYQKSKFSPAKVKELERLADNMYVAAQYLTTDASRLTKAMKEYHDYKVYHYKNDAQ